jgi:hypothetical protein
MSASLAFIKQMAADICQGNCTADGTGLPNVSANSGQITQVLQIVFGVIGVIAVIVIIIGGIELMTSLGGNPEAAKKARNTVIYASIGLLIAISAEFLVTFVLNKL